MILEEAFTLLLTLAGSLTSNVDDDSYMMAEEHDLGNHRKLLYEKVCNTLTDQFQMPCNTSWSLQHFMHKYLDEAGANVIYRTPNNWMIKTPLELYEQTQDFEIYGANKTGNITELEWTFKDFVEKYEPRSVWEQVKEAKMVGRNNTDRPSLINGMDSTDELLSLEVPKDGRRWWSNNWPMPKPPHKEHVNKATGNPDTTDLYTMIYIMKQSIYQARERIKGVQPLRQEYKGTALYKMGFLFAKTDYACKIFASLSYKSFRYCSTIRIKIYNENHIFLHMMDIVYNIERLICRWFDVDILKDLIVSNDNLARKVISKDKKLTEPKQVVQAFNEMFID